MPKQYPTELRQRAVRLVAEQRGQHQSEFGAIRSIAAKLGITAGNPLKLASAFFAAELDRPTPRS